MICKPCSIAGDLNSWNSRLEAQPTSPKYDQTIYILHNECKGRTHCDCAHKKGSGYINAKT